MLTGVATYPYIARLRCRVISTREVDPLLAQMFVLLSRATSGSRFPSASQKTLFFVSAFHALSMTLN